MMVLALVVILLITLAWDMRYGDVSCEVITPAPR